MYMQQRYYDPLTGRFLSVDPVVTGGYSGSGFGRYHYAYNNPYRYVDPDGQNAKDDFDRPEDQRRRECEAALACAPMFDSSSGTPPAPSGAANAPGGSYFEPTWGEVGVGVGSAVAAAAPQVIVIVGGRIAAKGVLADAKFAQRTFGRMFSEEGAFAGKSVEDVAAALRSGAMKPAQVEINYVVRDGKTIILNTRSSQRSEEHTSELQSH